MQPGQDPILLQSWSSTAKPHDTNELSPVAVCPGCTVLWTEEDKLKLDAGTACADGNLTTEAGTPALIVYLRTHELVDHAEYALLGDVAPVSGNGSVHELPLSSFSKSDVADGRLLLAVG